MEENKQIADTLTYQSQLMEVAGKDSRRIAAYRSAGTLLRNLEEPVRSLLSAESPAFLAELAPGMGMAIKAILETGTTPLGNDLEREIPSSVRQMLELSGLGPKKVAVIWREMGIETMGELYYSCLENRLAQAKGFGPKTQERLLKTIEFHRFNQRKFLYADVHPHLQQLEVLLEREFGPERLIRLTGEMRRLCPVVEKIQFVAAPGLYKELMLMLIQHSDYELLTAASDLLQASVRGTRILFEFLFRGADFYRELFLSTGTAAHLERFPLEEGIFYESEEQIYQLARINFIPPELREGAEEVRMAYRDALPKLVEAKDIRGLLHVHSDWSDGSDSIAEMAQACMEMGMEYMGLSDHSQSALAANGLSPNRVLAQQKEIEALNKGYKGFRILKGIESDILPNGELDYSPHELSSFDFVIASIHSEMKMTRDAATTRLLKAIRNPYTNVLGHMTGRLLLAREGYPLDHKAIVEACAAYEVAIELNANPHRLDLDWRWIRYAVECGVYIAINPDAHRKEALSDYLWGVNMARKGLLTAPLTLNAMSLDEIEEFFLRKRKQRIS